MSRSRSFLGGAVFAYIYQASLMLLGLWLTPFYIHTLGVRDYGIWLVGLSVLNFLLLCDFGVIVVTPRDVAHASGLEMWTFAKEHYLAYKPMAAEWNLSPGEPRSSR